MSDYEELSSLFYGLQSRVEELENDVKDLQEELAKTKRKFAGEVDELKSSIEDLENP